MTAAWMCFALVTGGAISAAAAAAERALSAGRAGRPRRFVWLAAVIATAAWPAAAWLAVRFGAGTPGAGAAPPSAYRLPALVVPAPADASTFDAALLAVWAAASALLLARLAAGAAATRRWRRRWPAARVDGVPVRVAPDAGPAVVGLRPMEVVLPAWALALDGPSRALVLRHEAEHQAAGDPYLLLAAALATALVPWHPALWWQARRLRLAVELDCDARVLRADPRPARYAGLLLAVAERRTGRGPRLAPAFLGLPGVPAPRSHLERRITAMQQQSSPRAPRLRSLASAAAALAAVGVACAVESPERPTGPQRAAPAAAVAAAEPQFFEFQIDQPAEPAGAPSPNFRYPAALRAAGTSGEVLAQSVVDADGRVDAGTITVLRATHPEFAESVRAALPGWRWRPARAGGRAVKQLVQFPIAFTPDP